MENQNNDYSNVIQFSNFKDCRTIMSQDASTLEEQNEELITYAEDLYKILKDNYIKESEFFDIEMSLLNLRENHSISDFFSQIISTVKETYKDLFVWISFIENKTTDDIISRIQKAGVLEHRLNLINTAQDDFKNLFKEKPLLINADDAFLSRVKEIIFLNNMTLNFQSMAVLPLTLNHTIIGSINFASNDIERFNPDMNIASLYYFGARISLCLDNIIYLNQHLKGSVINTDAGHNISNQCIAETQKGNRCKNTVRVGTTFCRVHVADGVTS